MVTLTNRYGCDSLVHLDLTVHPVIETSLEATICEGSVYELDGFAFNESGRYEVTFHSQFGCDSLVFLNLEVVPVRDTIIFAEIIKGTNYVMGDSVYIKTGIYTQILQSSFGCDSTVTLHLKVTDPVGASSLKEDNNSFISIFPNPAVDYVFVRFMQGEGDFFITILSPDGRVMERKEGRYGGDGYTELMDLTQLSSGLYFIVVETKGRFISKRIVIQ